MNAKFIVKTAWGVVKKHSTKLLAAGAIITEGFGFWFMHKRAPIARKKLDELGPDAKWIDKIKVAGPVYLPCAAMLIMSSACIIGGCAIGEAKALMMAELASASAAALQQHEKKMVEILGEEEAQKIHQEVAKDIAKAHPYDAKRVEYTSHGGQLFFDPQTARFFTSSEEFIQRAVEKINSKIRGDMWVSVNEFYDELDIQHARLGDGVGWNCDHRLEVSFYADRLEDGTYYGVLVYLNDPVLYNGKKPGNIRE